MENNEKNLVKKAFIAGVLKDFRWLENQLEKYTTMDAADTLTMELQKRDGEECQNRSE